MAWVIGATLFVVPPGCEDFEGVRGDDAGTTNDGGNSGSDGGTGSDGATSSDKFSLSTDPALYVDPGEQNVSLTVRITRAPGFTAPVSLSVNGLPSAIRPGPLTLGGSEAEGTLILGVDATAIPGGTKISVVGTTNDESASAPLSLYVTGKLMELEADGIVTVPHVAPPTLDFYLWGAGGGGGSVDLYEPGRSPTGGYGGAGGAAAGRIAVTAGDTLQALVGTGGGVRTKLSAGGGGYTALRRGETWLLIAGAGGGGGFGGSYPTATAGGVTASYGGNGGAGGGAAGQAAGPSPNAQGGSANAGGRAYDCTTTTKFCQAGAAGESLAGGQGGTQTTGGMPGGGGGGKAGAGGPAGGGGGFFGGGAGAHLGVGDFSNVGAGGGGGSGFADASVLPILETILLAGAERTPPLSDSPFYVEGTAVGGQRAESTYSSAEGYYVSEVPATAGGNGRLVVVLAKPTP